MNMHCAITVCIYSYYVIAICTMLKSLKRNDKYLKPIRHLYVFDVMLICT